MVKGARVELLWRAIELLLFLGARRVSSQLTLAILLACLSIPCPLQYRAINLRSAVNTSRVVVRHSAIACSVRPTSSEGS
jgi:hypothetical protein